MKNIVILVLIFLSILLYSSCRKKDMRKITQRDHQGFQMDEGDPSDWGNDEKLPGKINNLLDNVACDFEFSSSSVFSDDLEMIAYPNPVYKSHDEVLGELEYYRFFFDVSSNAVFIKYILVDRFNKVYASGCNQPQFCLYKCGSSMEIKFQSGKKRYYRLYYKMENADGNIIFQGHGDIEVNEETN